MPFLYVAMLIHYTGLFETASSSGSIRRHEGDDDLRRHVRPPNYKIPRFTKLLSYVQYGKVSAPSPLIHRSLLLLHTCCSCIFLDLTEPCTAVPQQHETWHKPPTRPWPGSTSSRSSLGPTRLHTVTNTSGITPLRQHHLLWP